MWPAWLQMLAARPQLLAEHGQAYVQLLGEESGEALATWRRQMLLHLATGLCLLTTLLLGGMAILLVAALPLAQMPEPWLLLVVPLFPLFVGLACWRAACQVRERIFVGLQEQMRADVALLQEIVASSARGTAP